MKNVFPYPGLPWSLFTFSIDSIIMTEVHELDPTIWDIAKSNQVSPYFRTFVNIAKYSGVNKYFARTKFHDYFCDTLRKAIERKTVDEEKTGSTFVAIQGIGKSSSTVYFVLSCIKSHEKPIHYIDMDLVRGDSRKSKLKDYIKTMQSDDILIIDHVTIFNKSMVQDIILEAPVSKTILIETCFFPSATKRQLNYLFDMNWQLSLEEFVEIWIKSLEKVQFSLENQYQFVSELYERCKDKYPLTPRLLQRVRHMLVHDGDKYDKEMREGRSINYFLMRYKTSLANDTTKFKLKLNEVLDSDDNSVSKQLCCEFSIHTKILLHQLKETDNIILARNQYDSFKIAMDFFRAEINVVNKDDLVNDLRFSELGLSVGDEYVKLSLLVPDLNVHWRDILPFKFEDIVDICNKYNLDSSKMLLPFFQSGGIRKELVGELIWLQCQLKSLIVPQVSIESHCKVSQTPSQCVLDQCNGVPVLLPSNITFLQPDLNDLEKISVGGAYQSHDKNVARLAVFVQKKIELNKEHPFMVWPSFHNLKGIDYLLYTETGASDMFRAPSKRRKAKLHTLYLVQVATGATHTGVPVGEALRIFKDIIKHLNIHVMILVAVKERDVYTLTGNMLFDNVSVVNLTQSSLYGLLKENKFLTSIVGMIRKS